MKFKRGDYYVFHDRILRYNSKEESFFMGGLEFYDPIKRCLLTMPSEISYLVTPATKLDLLLRGLDENIRIPSSKTASTGKR
jgi:hypothetical protein